jgi:hypothetical protein
MKALIRPQVSHTPGAEITPKPLFTLAGKSLLEIHIRRLMGRSRPS